MKPTPKSNNNQRFFTVERIRPLDNFYDFCPTVEEMIEILNEPERLAKDGFAKAKAEQFEQDYRYARAAVEAADGWDGEERGEPRMMFEPANDSYAFLFQLENDGICFIVSRYGMMWGRHHGITQQGFGVDPETLEVKQYAVV